MLNSQFQILNRAETDGEWELTLNIGQVPGVLRSGFCYQQTRFCPSNFFCAILDFCTHEDPHSLEQRTEILNDRVAADPLVARGRRVCRLTGRTERPFSVPVGERACTL